MRMPTPGILMNFIGLVLIVASCAYLQCVSFSSASLVPMGIVVSAVAFPLVLRLKFFPLRLSIRASDIETVRRIRPDRMGRRGYPALCRLELVASDRVMQVVAMRLIEQDVVVFISPDAARVDIAFEKARQHLPPEFVHEPHHSVPVLTF